jgi:hypothetical protein
VGVEVDLAEQVVKLFLVGLQLTEGTNNNTLRGAASLGKALQASVRDGSCGYPPAFYANIWDIFDSLVPDQIPVLCVLRGIF